MIALALVCVVGCKAAKERIKQEARDELEQRLGNGDPHDGEPEVVFPDPPPPADGKVGLAKGRYDIVAVGATVTRRAADGGPWDLLGGGAADPELTLLVDGKKVGGCTGAEDTPTVICEIGQRITVAADTELQVVVIDVDAMAHDHVGDATLADLTRTGRAGVRMKMTPHERVTSGFVELVRVPDPPTVWATQRWRILGGIAGFAGALLFLFGFRKNLFRMDKIAAPRAMPSTIGWRCAHCSADVALAEVTCHRCGASR